MPKSTVPAVMAPAPLIVPDVTVSEELEAPVKVPATFMTDKVPFTVTLSSMVTVIPEGITISSAVFVNEGADPFQVVELLQLPEAAAVYVAALEVLLKNKTSRTRIPAVLIVCNLLIILLFNYLIVNGVTNKGVYCCRIDAKD